MTVYLFRRGPLTQLGAFLLYLSCQSTPSELLADQR